MYYYPEQDNLFFTSEGIVNPSLGAAGIINPFVKQISLTGSELAELSVSEKFFPEFEDPNGNGQVDPEEPQNQGVRLNKGFEALTISLDQTTLVTAAENSLVQDGEVSDLSSGATARIVT